MRAWWIVVLGACSAGEPQVTVTVGDVGVFVGALDEPCECALSVGECQSYTDLEPQPEPCVCARTCIDLVQLLRDGISVEDTPPPGRNYPPLVPGDQLFILACDGREVTLDLPTTYPAPPTIKFLPEGIGWDVDPDVEYVEIVNPNAFAGEYCRVPAAPGSYPFQRSQGVLRLDAFAPQSVTPSALGDVHLVTMSRAETR